MVLILSSLSSASDQNLTHVQLVLVAPILPPPTNIIASSVLSERWHAFASSLLGFGKLDVVDIVVTSAYPSSPKHQSQSPVEGIKRGWCHPVVVEMFTKDIGELFPLGRPFKVNIMLPDEP